MIDYRMPVGLEVKMVCRTNRVSKSAAVTNGSTQLSSSTFGSHKSTLCTPLHFRRISERKSREDIGPRFGKEHPNSPIKIIERMQIQRRRNGVCRLSEQQRAAKTPKRHPNQGTGAKGRCVPGFCSALLFNVHVSRNLQTRCVLRASANRLDRVRHRC